MSDLIAFIKAIPVLLVLFQDIKAGIAKAQLDIEIQDHLAEVANAYRTGDSSKLDDVFNGVRESESSH